MASLYDDNIDNLIHREGLDMTQIGDVFVRVQTRDLVKVDGKLTAVYGWWLSRYEMCGPRGRQVKLETEFETSPGTYPTKEEAEAAGVERARSL